MGANAATKLLKVVDNLYSILGIELINAAQAVDLRGCDVGTELKGLLDQFRQRVPSLSDDRNLHPELVAASNFLKSEALVEESVLLSLN